MRKAFASIVLLALIESVAGGSGDEPVTARTVRYVTSIQLPGKGGRQDYPILDPRNHLLYASRTSDDMLVVIDTKTNKVVTTIDGLPKVRSIALVPRLGLGFATANGENKVAMIDLRKNQVIKKIPVGVGPDACLFNEPTGQVYVANHAGKSVSLIDPAKGEVVGTMKLGGIAEFARFDPRNGAVYQNLEDTNETVVVDTVRKEVLVRHPLAPGEGPTGLAYDPLSRRLFVGCAGNSRLVVLDAANGRVVKSLPIGDGCDFVAFDPKLNRIYTANGRSGNLTVIRQKSADEYEVIEQPTTQKGAYTMTLDPTTHRIYVAAVNQILVFDAVE